MLLIWCEFEPELCKVRDHGGDKYLHVGKWVFPWPAELDERDEAIIRKVTIESVKAKIVELRKQGMQGQIVTGYGASSVLKGRYGWVTEVRLQRNTKLVTPQPVKPLVIHQAGVDWLYSNLSVLIAFLELYNKIIHGGVQA